MRILGIDPSSSCTGVAIVENDKLTSTDAWTPGSIAAASSKLVDYAAWLLAYISMFQPDAAAIEFLSVQRNAETTRVISHYQGVSALVCKQKGLMVIEGRVTSARKIVLGKGNLKKKEVFEQIKKMFPDHSFGRWEKPGGDETDAVCMAVAGVELAER